MPLRPRAIVPALAAAIALAAAPARADSCHASPLYGTCIDSDTLWSHAGPSRFFAIGSSDTVAAGHMGFGLVTDYISRPIVLHVASPGPPGTDQYAINDQVNGTFLWSYGVTRRLELDVAVPITFGQGGTGIAPLSGTTTHLQDTAIRDVRFGAAYTFVRRDAGQPWGIAGRFEVSAPTGDHDQLASNGVAVFVPSLAADWRHGHWFAGAEIGARLRKTEQLVGARVGTQGVIAVGVGYDLLKRPDLLGVALEARTLPTFAKQADVRIDPQATVTSDSSSVLAPSEWMLSLRSAPLDKGDVTIQLGGGGPIPTGDAITTPRWRFALGVRFAPGEKASAAAMATATAAAAVPRLNLAGAKDGCHDEPDSVDGFTDDEGCPDEDTDKDGVDDRLDKCPDGTSVRGAPAAWSKPGESEDYAGLLDGCGEKK